MRHPRAFARVILVLLVTGGPALGHGPARTVQRDLLRIQGYRSSVPEGTPVEREAVFLLLGEEHRFHATEWQTFGFGERANRIPAADRERFAVQGERSAVARIASARPGQRVTILAERRPGSADLFLVAVDLCPAD